MFLHVFRCVIGITDRPDRMSSIVMFRISEALSPIDSHSRTKEQIWHLLEVHEGGWRDAKSLVYISLPGRCLSSTGSELNPVKKVDILELAENAPRRLRFHASTHGCESVKCIVTFNDSRM